MGVRLTSAAMKVEMYAIVRKSEDRAIFEENDIKIAINRGMVNIETFVMEHYPYAEIVEYNDRNACYKAVSDGMADCALVSNYRILTSEENFDNLKLTTVPTGEALPFSFAVNKDDSVMYFLMY